MKKLVRKKALRLRRAQRSRAKMKELKVNRLIVHKSPKHIYAQIISHVGKVLAFAATVEKSFKDAYGKTGNIDAAKEIGKLIAARAKDIGVTQLAFDRSGFKYHGRVKALAESAREGGLKF